MPSVFLEWQRENSGGLQQENRHFKLNLVSLPSQYPVHWVVQEAHDLMTASCPSWTNRARHTRRFAAAALWPRAKRIDFPLNGMRADERKTERTRERAGGRAGGERGETAVNPGRESVRGRVCRQFGVNYGYESRSVSGPTELDVTGGGFSDGGKEFGNRGGRAGWNGDTPQQQ